MTPRRHRDGVIVLKFCPNIGMLFNEVPFLDRFEACRQAGFKMVEFPWPYAYSPGELKAGLADSGLDLLLFDFPVGDWDGGDRGDATHPDKVSVFRDGVELGLGYAAELNVTKITCLVGKRLPEVPYAEQWRVLVKNLQFTCDRCSDRGITVLCEIFNEEDHPGFFLTRSRQALDLLKAVGRDNCRILYDVYHMQKTEGNLIDTLRCHLDSIGHIQIADVPGRHQPGTGEINYRFLLKALEGMGYDRWIGLEYLPDGPTLASLDWLQKFSLT